MSEPVPEVLITINMKSIRQRQSDHYISATDMCAAVGKRLDYYASCDRTQRLIYTLKHNRGIATPVDPVRGTYGGTYVHPRVAIHLASYCSESMFDTFLELIASHPEWGVGSSGQGDALEQSRHKSEEIVRLCNESIEKIQQVRDTITEWTLSNSHTTP